ncbi:hypothetical protein N826_27050 [Skermanella aerolata KACC 11604]|uniref:hypothetical protein n=2 Tax=Skermanella aerolata TaxID=393310 RepID=UPI0005C9F015|nr:hypothetical protein [Skermanella aerolata]KJB91563.1 hypothetical protein N826_27050 [Skermanella aerolata KACC 11604]
MPKSKTKSMTSGLLIFGTLALASFGTPALARDLPKTPDELISTVSKAITERDMAVFEDLVNWKDARKIRKRVVSYQIRTTFGRPIRSIALEDFPADGLKETESRGTQKANMAVSHRLRVIFDEPPGESGIPPTDVFLIGKEQDVYRIALVNPVPRKDND